MKLPKISSGAGYTPTADDKRVLICGPIDRIGTSISKTCDTCGTGIQVSPASLIAADGENLRILCVRCGIKEIQAEADEVFIMPVTEAQKREWLEHAQRTTKS